MQKYERIREKNRHFSLILLRVKKTGSKFVQNYPVCMFEKFHDCVSQDIL